MFMIGHRIFIMQCCFSWHLKNHSIEHLPCPWSGFNRLHTCMTWSVRLCFNSASISARYVALDTNSDFHFSKAFSLISLISLLESCLITSMWTDLRCKKRLTSSQFSRKQDMSRRCSSVHSSSIDSIVRPAREMRSWRALAGLLYWVLRTGVGPAIFS